MITHSVIMLLGMATETVQSLGTVGANLADGLNVFMVSLRSAPSPYLPSFRFCISKGQYTTLIAP